MLSPNIDSEQLVEIVKSGAAACTDKNATAEELTDIVKRVHRGEYPINESILSKPKVAERVLKQFQDMVSMGHTSETIGSPLTNRETQILQLIAEGNSNKQIASSLEISEQTIKNHVRRFRQ
jgi:DNA-binding NarL/FixJ family response regulator